jgi:hypothetical protein
MSAERYAASLCGMSDFLIRSKQSKWFMRSCPIPHCDCRRSSLLRCGFRRGRELAFAVVAGLAASLLSAALLVAQQSEPETTEPPSQTRDQNQTLEQAPATASTDGTSSAADTRITIRGQVRDALTGEPLARALVRVEGDSPIGTLTDSEGRFEIPGVPTGQQIVKVRKPGYYDRSSAGTENDTSASAHNILVAAPMPELSLALAPTGSIRGEIVLSTGDPALGITVDLFRRSVRDGRGQWRWHAVAQTDSEGRYRFANLTAGSYMLYTESTIEGGAGVSLFEPGSASKVALSGYPGLFYPEARSLEAAARISIGDGEQAQANFALRPEPFYAVSAKVLFPGSTSAAAQVEANVLDASGHRLVYSAQFDAATGTVQSVLPNGSYTLLVSSQPENAALLLRGKELIATTASNAHGLAGSVQFSVAGGAVTSLSIPLAAPPAHQLQLTVIHALTRSTAESASATSPVRQGSIDVTASEGDGISAGLVNSFAVQMQPGLNSTSFLPPGSYWLRATTGSTGFCEHSFTVAGASLAREPLLMSLGGTVPSMELTVRDDCARLSLSLPPALQALTPGEEHNYTVYVVPAFDSTSAVEPITLGPSGGSLTVDGLTPGDYRVYTLSESEHLEYHNAAAMAALSNSGQPVTLSPGATSYLVLEVPAGQ